MVATWRLSRAAAERSPVGSAAYIAPSIETRLALWRETRRESQPRPRSEPLAAESDKLHTTLLSSVAQRPLLRADESEVGVF